MFGEIDLYLAQTEYHISLPCAVVLQELVAHPTRLHSQCPQVLFIIGALLAYCLCQVAEAVCEKKEAWEVIDKTKETGKEEGHS